MLYLPPLRRFLLPSLIVLTFIVWWRSSHVITRSVTGYLIDELDITPPGERIPIQELHTRRIFSRDPEENYKSPATDLYYDDYDDPTVLRLQDENAVIPYWARPKDNPYMAKLYECPILRNPHTRHIRLPYYLRNITMTFRGNTENEKKRYLNPALISLPFWHENQYLLVSRVDTDGSYMENLICEANICYTKTNTSEPARPGDKLCTETDLELLGGAAGMRCATPPLTLNVPSTPAESCGEGMGILMDIPGFHDPRIFWTARGEPMMMVNTQSRYACFGLWAIDLRKLYFPLDESLLRNPHSQGIGPLMSYPSLTELTRNPAKSRGMIEKNWMFFGTRTKGTYIHYDMGPSKRSFAKLLGGGLTTVNLTDPFEKPCLEDAGHPSDIGSWHQATNSLRLVLCNRNDRNKPECKPNGDNEVFFSLIHHKHKGPYGLPFRYERYFIVWSAAPPFSMLGVSRHPVLLLNETAHPWNGAENWEDDPDQQHRVQHGLQGKDMWATFTYTVSLAYAWRAGDQPHDKAVGYLDDLVILGVGVDDWSQVYARVPAQDLLSCLRACPGREEGPLDLEELAQYSPDDKQKKDDEKHEREYQERKKKDEEEKKKKEEEEKKKKEEEEQNGGAQNEDGGEGEDEGDAEADAEADGDEEVADDEEAADEEVAEDDDAADEEAAATSIAQTTSSTTSESTSTSTSSTSTESSSESSSSTSEATAEPTSDPPSREP